MWRDAPDRPGLDDVGRAGVEERSELLDAGEVLARRDRRADRRAQSGVPDGIPPSQRLLDPEQVDLLLERADVAHRLLDLPRLVRVEHEPGSRRVAAQRVGEDAQSPQVGVEVESALELAARRTRARRYAA